MMLLLAFVALLAVHWVADFVCQTHWQASNKSKDNVALLRHVGAYTAVLAVGSVILLMGFATLRDVGLFVLLNGVLHFATDWFTSRWSSRHFAMAMHNTFVVRDAGRLYGANADLWLAEHHPDLKSANHWHNFFVLLGFDQLIHQVTLAATLYFIIGGF